jgi:hypothetical protein
MLVGPFHPSAPDKSTLTLQFRLIDLSRLCVVDATPEYPYVALSYVWGDSQRLLLRDDNIARLTDPGGLSETHTDSPQTFLGAMYVAS